MAEGSSKTAGNDEFVGRRFIHLPKVRTDVGNGRHRCVAGTKYARMQIYRHALGQRIACSLAAYPEDGASIRLIVDRGEIAQRGAQALLECWAVLAVSYCEPLPRCSPDKRHRTGDDAPRDMGQPQPEDLTDATCESIRLVPPNIDRRECSAAAKC